MSTTDYRAELLVKLEDHKKLAEANEPAARAGEASTINFLVRPFVEDVLGFSFKFPNHVDQEFDVGAPGKNEKVDIVLIVATEPAVLLEVKRRGLELTEKDVKQLQNYFTWVKTAKFAVLTDGIEWQWFKGEPGAGNGNFMENTPFLVHRVTNPTAHESDWIAHVSMGHFDVDRLTNLSRQIEFTTKLREWIARTLEEPNADGAKQVNKWVSLGASKHEMPLVENAIRSAWASFQSEGFDPPKPLPPKIDEIDLEIVQETQLVLADGEVLLPGGLPRAWRLGEGEWRKTTDAKNLVATVLSALLGCDSRRNDEARLARELDLDLFDSRPADQRFSQIHGFASVYCNTRISNWQKGKLLERLATKIDVDTSVDHPLTRGVKLQCWLPTGASKPKNSKA